MEGYYSLTFFIPRYTIVVSIMVSNWTSVCLSVRLSVSRTSICFSFLDNNLSKCQWIFIKLGMCIDIVKIWFGIANGQILSIFLWSYLPKTCPYFGFRMITSKHQWIFTKLGMCIDIVNILFGIANGQIPSVFDRVTCIL